MRNGFQASGSDTAPAVREGADARVRPAVGREAERVVRAHVRALLLPDANPVPSCPNCRGTTVNKKGYTYRQTGARLPTYQCADCGRHFTRASGTPLARRSIEEAETFISLLYRPLSCVEAAQRLSIDAPAVRRMVNEFRQWLLDIEPGGQLARLILLGGRFAFDREAQDTSGVKGSLREDPLLSDTLLNDFDEIHAPLHGPTACPACGNVRVLTKGIVGGMPRYKCSRCGKQFNRRSGTPFARNREVPRQRELIRYLSLPVPVTQLATMIQTDMGITARLVEEFRARCLQLDPSGGLATRIRAGERPDEKTPCVWCGSRRLRFYADIRPVRCTHCGRFMSMRREITERGGLLEVGAWEGVAEEEAQADILARSQEKG